MKPFHPKSLSPAARWFIVTDGIYGLGAGLSNFMLNLHLLELGMDERMVGQIASVGFLASGLLSLPIVYLLQYVNRKQMLIAGLILDGMSIAGYGLASSLPAFLLLQMTWGCGLAMVLTSETQLLYEYCRSRSEERRAYSYMFASFMLCNGTGMFLGGILPVWLGGFATRYQFSFFAAAGFLFACAILRQFLLPPSTCTHLTPPDASARSAKEPEGAHGPKIRPPFHVPRPWNMLWALSFLLFLAGLLQGFLNPFWNVILKYRLDWADSSVSLAMTFVYVFIFLGAMITPRLGDHFGVHRAMTIVFAANVVLALLMAAALPVSAFVSLLLVREAVFIMFSNLVNSETMSVVPEVHRNLFAAMKTIAGNLGTSLATLVTGRILAANDCFLPFAVTGAAFMAGYLIYVWWIRKHMDHFPPARHGPADDMDNIRR